ncbi:MAG: hypothetical protein M0R28_20265 [Pigmentiphaga sp.]|nr:hypothetical protein [Pigmentiphaga sp.]
MAYNLIQVGSLGPAHPLHDPRVRVYVNGSFSHIAASAKEGHLWAIRQGHSPENKALLDSPRYQELMAQVRYAQEGL